MPDIRSDFPHVAFTIHREYLEDDGLWNPRLDDPPLEAGFQINVYGNREHYLRLADAIRAFAEAQHASQDTGHHDHFEGLLSINGKARLHVILRKGTIDEHAQ